jgi:ribosome recycling factor
MDNLAEVKKNTEQRMHKSLEALKADLGKVRTGRAHAGLLDHVMVDYYGTQTPIPKVANVSLIDGRTLGVSPWEKKMVGAIEKAIRDSDLGLNPASHGDMVRVPMPALTEERRRDLVKVIKHEGENAKVAVRNLRRDANNALKEMLKKKTVSEDQERRAQDEVQKLTDKHIADIDKMIAAKEAELIAV